MDCGVLRRRISVVAGSAVGSIDARPLKVSEQSNHGPPTGYLPAPRQVACGYLGCGPWLECRHPRRF